MPATVVGHQFTCITLTVDICIQHDGREAPRRAGLSAAAETSYYFAAGSWTNIAISVSVCMSVCLSVRSHSSKTPRRTFTEFYVHVLPVAVARSSSDGNAIS